MEEEPTEAEMEKEVLEMLADMSDRIGMLADMSDKMSDTLSSCMRNEAAGWGRLSYYHSWTTLKKSSLRSIRDMTDVVPLPSETPDDVSVMTPHPAARRTQVKRFLKHFKQERLPSIRTPSLRSPCMRSPCERLPSIRTPYVRTPSVRFADTA